MPDLDFSHVVDSHLRGILGGDVSEDAICYALTVTGDALQSDSLNQEIPLDVLGARQQAFEDADFCWNEEGDIFGTLESLQKFWSV